MTFIFARSIDGEWTGMDGGVTVCKNGGKTKRQTKHVQAGKPILYEIGTNQPTTRGRVELQYISPIYTVVLMDRKLSLSGRFMTLRYGMRANCISWAMLHLCGKYVTYDTNASESVGQVTMSHSTESFGKLITSKKIVYKILKFT